MSDPLFSIFIANFSHTMNAYIDSIVQIATAFQYYERIVRYTP